GGGSVGGGGGLLDGVEVRRRGARWAEVFLPLDVAGAVQLEDQRAGVLIGAGEAAGRDVAAVGGLPDLVDDGAGQTNGVDPRPGALARCVGLFHAGARAPPYRRAGAARPAFDGLPAHDVAAVRGLLDRAAVRVVARPALRTGAADLLLPLRDAGGVQLDQPVHTQARSGLGLGQRDVPAVRGDRKSTRLNSSH